jgi:hypothetical protein
MVGAVQSAHLVRASNSYIEPRALSLYIYIISIQIWYTYTYM